MIRLRNFMLQFAHLVSFSINSFSNPSYHATNLLRLFHQNNYLFIATSSFLHLTFARSFDTPRRCFELNKIGMHHQLCTWWLQFVNHSMKIHPLGQSCWISKKMVNQPCVSCEVHFSSEWRPIPFAEFKWNEFIGGSMQDQVRRRPEFLEGALPNHWFCDNPATNHQFLGCPRALTGF